MKRLAAFLALCVMVFTGCGAAATDVNDGPPSQHGYSNDTDARKVMVDGTECGVIEVPGTGVAVTCNWNN